ncbi:MULTISPECIES: hypothetical protein [Cryobacterium]|uniref:Uncharacterized protein n=1 Tax=Cryobacterium breve TaxID=1259258 RepID=A0ABY2J802_9MICO|nr:MULTISPECIES: hypothetical protein [Cryobacterium]TFC92068.1 hypothetical protein E3T20_12195 [Cryobacterium sp. TmT3-12]TFC99793.1 hypothetical protein E3O65_05310 [Cryobacterium breve]
MSYYTLGLSAQAIAGSGTDHPWDPGDLRRCIDYCSGRLTTEQLRTRMAGRSISWDRLLPEWDKLVALLQIEMDTATNGRAPRTYAEMRRVLDGGVKCATCDGSGRGDTCVKCNGTGHRCGGTCRAVDCHSGAALCSACRGNGYTVDA